MGTIILDKTYDKEFVRKVEEISGENFHKCLQCGTCSGGCPMGDDMDIPPRKIVLMAHFGMKDKIEDSNTVWLCASCHTCFARCPRGLDIPKIMEAIRQVNLRNNVNFIEPSEIGEEDLANLPQIALVSCFRKHTA